MIDSIEIEREKMTVATQLIDPKAKLPKDSLDVTIYEGQLMGNLKY